MYELDDDVVALIRGYMNDVHSDALTQIAASHGFSAGAVQITGMSGTELLLCSTNQDRQELVIAWPAPLQRREDIRRYLQQMEDDARSAGQD